MKKHSQEEYDTFNLPNIIMPGEPEIRKAVSNINKKMPGFFGNVKEIRISTDGSSYGYVTSEEGKEGIIFINLPRIKTEVQSKTGTTEAEQIEEVIIKAVQETVAHEKGHIDAKLEGGEFPAEQKARDAMRILNACEVYCDLINRIG